MKYTFLDYIGQCVPKNKVRRLCQEMELTDKETRLILERYCDKVSADVVEFISYTEQRTMIPHLEAKIVAWFWDNLSFFNPHEVKELVKRMAKGD